MSKTDLTERNVFNQLWHTSFTPTQYWVIFGFIALAGLALISMWIWSFTQRRRYLPRYRLVTTAGLTLTAVASLSYVVVFFKLVQGYAFDSSTELYVPQVLGVLDVPARYLDWAITVPLLVVQLVGVSALAPKRARLLRLAGAAAGFLMILTGYLGEFALSEGASALQQRLSWGLVSTGFFAIVYGIVIYAAAKSVRQFSPALSKPYRGALTVLLAVWFVYPIVYGINGFASGGDWAASAQVAYCSADIISKVGFGLLIQKVARLRMLEPEPPRG